MNEEEKKKRETDKPRFENHENHEITKTKTILTLRKPKKKPLSYTQTHITTYFQKSIF